MRDRLILLSRAVPILMVGVALFLAGCQLKSMVVEKPAEEDPVPRLYAKGKLHFKEERYAEAVKVFNGIITEHPGHPRMPAVKFDMARSYYHLGNLERCLSISLEWISQYPDNPLKGDVCLLLADSYKNLNDVPKTFLWLVNSLTSLQEGRGKYESVESRINNLINTSPAQDLEKMAKYDEENLFTPLIYKRLTAISLEENRLQEAKNFAMQLVQSTKEQSWVDTGKELLDRINKRIESERNVKKNVIGCLLPLTGPYALYGQELLNGIQLGMDIFGRTESDQELELVIRNTNGTQEGAVAGLEELFYEEKAVTIVGPLASGPATAAVKKAQELRVPIISFTQKSGITGEGDMVFRNFLTPSKEVEAVLNRAINEMDMQRFGIFYPENAYGRFLMNTFWDKVEEMGGTITAVESYYPDETDFENEIKKMVGLYYPRPESITRMLEEIEEKEERMFMGLDSGGEGWVEEQFNLEVPLLEDQIMSELQELIDKAEDDDEPEPIVDFDAVFIPGSYQHVALIAPQFPFYNVFNVPFLGTSLWHSEELIETTGSYIQGAIFPIGFFIDADSQDVQAFVKSFRENFKTDPGVLAASGYDTIKYIKNILKNDEVRTRTDFQRQIYQNDPFYGITGKISFDPHGEVEKAPFLLTVYGRRFHLLEGIKTNP